MKIKAFFAAALFLPMTILAQDKDIQEAVEHPEKENFLKINLTSLPLKNYQLQFEHVLSRKLSVALGARIMPNSGIPFKSVVLEAIGDDQDTRDLVEKFKTGHWVITFGTNWIPLFTSSKPILTPTAENVCSCPLKEIRFNKFYGLKPATKHIKVPVYISCVRIMTAHWNRKVLQLTFTTKPAIASLVR